MRKEISPGNADRFIELGIRIGTLRIMRGLSREELAERAGIREACLSSIEAPDSVRPFSLEVLYNIADALEIEPHDLLKPSCLIPE